MDINHSDVSCPPDDIVAEALDDPISDGDSETEGEESIRTKVRSIGTLSPQMLGEDLTSFEGATKQKNIICILTEQEIEEVDAKEANPESI